MRVCPDASWDDGLLDVVLVGAVSRTRFVRMFPRVFTGTHPDLAEVTVLRGQRVTIAALDGSDVVAYADGERLSALPVTCEVAPGSLRMLVAAPAGGGPARTRPPEGRRGKMSVTPFRARHYP